MIVRYGGDEFLCAMPDIGAPEARARFLKICHALAAVDAEYSLELRTRPVERERHSR